MADLYKIINKNPQNKIRKITCNRCMQVFVCLSPAHTILHFIFLKYTNINLFMKLYKPNSQSVMFDGMYLKTNLEILQFTSQRSLGARDRRTTPKN